MSRRAPRRGTSAKGRPGSKATSSGKGKPPSKGAGSRGPQRGGRGSPKGSGAGGARQKRTGSPRAGSPRAGSPRGLGGTQVEGRQAVRELLLAGERRVHDLMLSTDGAPSEIVEDIVDLARERRVQITEMSRARIDAASHTESSQGVIAHAAELSDHDLDTLLQPREARQPFLVACDGVTDPGNLGALLRIAECAGVTGVVLPRHRAVHVTPTVTKTAAGAIEYLPMSLVGGLPSAIEDMKAADVLVVGLDAGGDTEIHEFDIGDRAVCLVLGAEGKGLSRLVRQRCDTIVSIPLHGSLASLNVAAAGAIACYEVARQRTA